MTSRRTVSSRGRYFRRRFSPRVPSVSRNAIRCRRRRSKAWKGPAPSVRDPRVRALSYALLAPNPHNLQPWIVDLREPSVITFFSITRGCCRRPIPIRARSRSAAARFSSCCAWRRPSKVFVPTLRHFPRAIGRRTRSAINRCAASRLCRSQHVPRDPLFAQALKRRTNRSSLRGDARRALVKQRRLARDGCSCRCDSAWTIDAAADDALARYRQARVGRRDRQGRDLLRERQGLSRDARARFWGIATGLSFHGPFFWSMKALGLFSKERALTRRCDRAPAIARLHRRRQLRERAGLRVDRDRDERPAGAARGGCGLRARQSARRPSLGLAVQPFSQALRGVSGDVAAACRAQARGRRCGERARCRCSSGWGVLRPVEPSPRRPLDAIVRA